jgi:hypothetical protein
MNPQRLESSSKFSFKERAQVLIGVGQMMLLFNASTLSNFMDSVSGIRALYWAQLTLERITQQRFNIWVHRWRDGKSDPNLTALA